jgi:hypothetical protein
VSAPDLDGAEHMTEWTTRGGDSAGDMYQVKGAWYAWIIIGPNFTMMDDVCIVLHLV